MTTGSTSEEDVTGRIYDFNFLQELLTVHVRSDMILPAQFSQYAVQRHSYRYIIALYRQREGSTLAQYLFQDQTIL